jgi:hypothetical protein
MTNHKADSCLMIFSIDIFYLQSNDLLKEISIHDKLKVANLLVTFLFEDKLSRYRLKGSFHNGKKN